MLICETWLNDNISNSMLNISEYYIDDELRVDRKDTNNGIGGGLIVYVRNDLVIKPDINNCNFNQYCQFQIMQRSDLIPINIVLVYRSPNSSRENNMELVNLFEKTKPVAQLSVTLTTQMLILRLVTLIFSL